MWCLSFWNAKMTSLSSSISKSKKCFDLIHVDLWRPYSIPSILGHKYFLTIVDDYSRYAWISLLKQKSEIVNILENFVTFVQTQFEEIIKIIRSDNGTEFVITNFFAKKGIVHQTSSVDTLQQNSIVERKHGHYLNVVRALMIQSHLPKIYWLYSVIHVAYIINMLPTPILNDFSPYEMLYKIALDFNQLKVFGSLYAILALCQQIEKSLIQGHQNVFSLVLKKEQKDMFCSIFSLEKFLCLGMFYFMNIFFHIKRLRILVIKLTILTFSSKSIYRRSTWVESTFTSHFCIHCTLW